MVKNYQTVRPQKPTNCLSVFDHFAELELKGLILQPAVHKHYHINCATPV